MTRQKLTMWDIDSKLKDLLRNYKMPALVHKLRNLVFSLPRKKMAILTELANNMLVEQTIPKHLPLIIKDLVSFKLGLHRLLLNRQVR